MLCYSKLAVYVFLSLNLYQTYTWLQDLTLHSLLANRSRLRAPVLKVFMLPLNHQYLVYGNKTKEA
jgi:hypothetical protein